MRDQRWGQADFGRRSGARSALGAAADTVESVCLDPESNATCSCGPRDHTSVFALGRLSDLAAWILQSVRVESNESRCDTGQRPFPRLRRLTDPCAAAGGATVRSGPMAVRIKSITFDCTDLYRLAQFWSQLTGFVEGSGRRQRARDPEALLAHPIDRPRPSWSIRAAPDGRRPCACHRATRRLPRTPRQCRP